MSWRYDGPPGCLGHFLVLVLLYAILTDWRVLAIVVVWEVLAAWMQRR